MKPHSPKNKDQSELFRSRLDGQINMNHELVRLSSLIDWSVFDDRFGSLDQVRRLCGQRIEEVYVDRGYRGHHETDSAVYISGQKRGVTDRIRRCMKRRQAIEPVIGHLKQDGWLGRNHLKGTAGDGVNVLLSCDGHNLRLILKRLRGQCARIFVAQFLTGLFGSNRRCRG